MLPKSFLKSVLLFFLLFFYTVGYSITPGIIEGYVKDAATKEPLPYANVRILGTSMGAAADLNGKFIISNVAPGEYTLSATYVGYQKLNLTVTVKEGQKATVNFNLKAENIEGETVIVTAQAEGQNKAINQQLASISIVNVVSSARIQELPDANAAESIGRLPGVSVLRDGGEGNKVVIRGLSPKYNNITVDGVKLAATGLNDKSTFLEKPKDYGSKWDKYTDRSADLSMISPNMLEGIEVVKAITPDMDADVLGGSVNFKMKEAAEGLHYDFIAQGGYNNLKSTYDDYKFVGGVDTRLFDNKFGILFQGNLEKRNRSSNEQGAYYYLEGPKLGQLNTPLISSLVLSDIIRDKDRKGATLVLDYQSPIGKFSSTNFYSHTKTDILNRYERYSINENMKYYGISETKSTINVLTNSIKYEGDFNILKIDGNISHSYSENKEPENYFGDFFQRQVGLNEVDRKVPPTAVPAYAKVDTSRTILNDMSYYSNQSKDREITANIDLTYHISFSDNFTGKIKFGGKYRYKDREYDHEESNGNLAYSGAKMLDLVFQYYPWMRNRLYLGGLLIGNFWDSSVDFGNFMKGEYELIGKTNINTLKGVINAAREHPEGLLESWYTNDILNNRSDYSGNEYSKAGYLMAELDVTSRLKIIPGFRYEHLTTKYTAPHGNSSYSDASRRYLHVDTTVEKSNGYFLPMAHIRYKATDWFDVRFAYTNTLTYPDFTAIVPLLDVGINRVMWNNPNLKAARAQNFDLYVSFYENYIGLLTIGGFYKEIKDLIIPWYDRIIQNPSEFEGVPQYTKGYYIDTWINNPNKAFIKGFEVEWQTHFWYLPGVLSGTVFNINYTHIKSEAKYPLTKYEIQYINQPPWVKQTIIDTFYTNRLLDQPDDILNISLGFDYKGFSIRTSMIYQSDIFKGVNFWEELRKSTDDYTRFDISVKQDLPWYGLQIFGNITNLNRAKDVALVKGNGFPSAEQHYDMTMDVGLRIRF